MRILIAEDDAIGRKVLTTFLERAEYAVVPCVDGLSALELLAAPDSPSIAILDWMMPGLSGLEVCSRVRATNKDPRPYIIILSARASKEDIITGFDAGADDYLPKPFNPMELYARLRVAKRTLDYQNELKRHVVELASLVERYTLLAEIAGRLSSPAVVASPPPEPNDAQSLRTFTDEQVGSVGTMIALELCLGEVHPQIVENAEPYRQAPFTAWAGLILQQEQLWIDVLLEADTKQLPEMYKKSLRRPPRSQSESLGFLVEMQTILGAALKTDLQAEGVSVLSAGLSHARAAHAGATPFPSLPPQHRSYHFTSAGTAFGLTVSVQQVLARQKVLSDLRVGDVLAKPVFLPDMKQVPLLSMGLVLNEHYLERLAGIFRSGRSQFLAHVFEPSLLARFFSE